jgi:hypothetical protein
VRNNPEQLTTKAIRTDLKFGAVILDSIPRMDNGTWSESSHIFRRLVRLRRTGWQVSYFYTVRGERVLMSETYLDSPLPAFGTPEARLSVELACHPDLV